VVGVIPSGAKRPKLETDYLITSIEETKKKG
jgi:hypothetical protein